MKYLKKFENVAAFEAVQATLDKPNVSLIEEINKVNYLPYVESINPFVNDPYIDDPKLVVIYNVTSTEEDTLLIESNYDGYCVNSMEIDGVELNEVVNTYRFNTLGEHVVKYDWSYINEPDGPENRLINHWIEWGDNSDNNIKAPIIRMYIPESIELIDWEYTLFPEDLILVTIPSTISSIGNGAFNGCSNLNIIICKSNIAPSLYNNNVFENISQTGTLYVPTGATGYDVWLTALGSGWTKVEF